MREEKERTSKSRVEEKMKSHAGIYKAQNIYRYATVKGSTQQRSVSTQRRRALCCDVELFAAAYPKVEKG